MKKINKKGFTLVELLATLVILGLLTVIAAPNIIGILTNTKLNTYISDANKLQTLAEYKFRSDSKITRPGDGQCVILTMNYLGTSEFKNPPYGGEYKREYSYVAIKKEGSEYKYYVQLIELSDGKYSGIKLIEKSFIKKDSSVDFIEVGMNVADLIDSNGTPTICSSVQNSYQ